MSQNFETFGKYILLEKLAMGGMAEIYLARNSGVSGVSKFVAIKRILPQFTEQPEFIDMFKDEAKIAINLAHANVVSIAEFGLEKEQFFIAMDYIEGRNLRQILNKMKKGNLSFSIEQVLYMVKEVAAGLDHAHRCIDANTGKPLNIIHRDMSPQNVMVSFEGEVKIVDFGIAKAETQLETTRAGTLKGKFGYMSPEQAEGQQVDLRTDVFALGILLWELLANDRLFVANNEVNTLRKIRDCQVPSLRKINPNIQPELERIVSKALAKDRNLRYQTAASLHRDLSRFLNRQYPDFSPQDFSVFVKTLFAGEILESRKKMVEFARVDNDRQNTLSAVKAAMNKAVPETTIVTTTAADVEDSEPDVNFGADHKRVTQEQPTPTPEAPRAITPPAPPPLRAQPANIAPPKEGPKRVAEPVAPRSNEPRLQVDRSGFGTGVYNGGTFANRSNSQVGIRTTSSSQASSYVILIMALVVICGSGYYYLSHKALMDGKIQTALQGLGLSKAPVLIADSSPSVTPEQPLKAADETYEVKITSTPSGAPIEIDGETQGEVTPASLTLRKGRRVKLVVRLAGYLPSPYEERFVVDGSRLIDVKFKSDKKGFLNVIVKGEGQIYVNSKLVATTSPARMIAVPAEEDIQVIAFDPKTRATDQIVTNVGEGATRTLTLTPRAAAEAPRIPATNQRK